MINIKKRSGKIVDFNPNKIYKRIKDQCFNLKVDIDLIFQKVISGICSEMTTKEIDSYIATCAADQIIQHPDYSYLASRILITRQSKEINVIPEKTDYEYDFFGISSFFHKYSLRDDNGNPIELPHMMYKRVSDYLEVPNLYENISNRNISLATPILINSGTERKSLISCNITTLKDDSLEGINNTLNCISTSSKDGAGIGLHIHNLRSKESLVSSFKGNAGGVIRFADMVQSHMRFFKQGNRAGSCAITLGVWHKDILDFIDLKAQVGQDELRTRDLFTTVAIPDLFMKKLISGDDDWYLFCPNDLKLNNLKPLHDCYGEEFESIYNNAVSLNIGKKVSLLEIWNKILHIQVEAGNPCIFFWDNANKNNWQENIGIIRGSNLCVAPDTLILTDKGYVEISSVSGTKVNIWNGFEYSESKVFKTSDREELINVCFSNASEMNVTKNHEWFIYSGSKYSKKIIKKKTSDLKIGDSIINFELPVINFENELNDAYTQGLFSAEGSYANNMPIIVLYGEKRKLLPFLNIRNNYFAGTKTISNNIGICEYDKKTVVKLALTILEKEFVPLQYNIKSQLDWLSGLIDGDGTMCTNGKTKSIQITSVNFKFLKNIKLMLNTLGCSVEIKIAAKEGFKKLPDGNGNNKDYFCQTTYRLFINNYNLFKLIQLGLNTKRINLSNVKNTNRKCNRLIKIIDIKKNNIYSETYCLTEPLKNSFVANGVITGNCVEFMGVSDVNMTSQCCLGLINLANLKLNDFDEIRKRTRLLVITLNKIIDKNKWSTIEAEFGGLGQRTIGIGIAGLADYYAKHNINFISEESSIFNNELLKVIDEESIIVSSELAKVTGNYPMYKNSYWDKNDIPMRNSLRICLMPSASTSVLLGVNEMFEPFESNIFIRKIDKAEFIMINKWLVKDLENLNLWNNDIRSKILNNNGSVQNIKEIPLNIQEKYKTIWEIKQKDLIDLAAIRQKHIDQGQSLNLYFKDPTSGKIGAAIKYCWEKGLKTIYYTKTKSKLEAPKRLGGELLPEKPKDSIFECFGCTV